MSHQVNEEYYTARKHKLLEEFLQEALSWKPVMTSQYGHSIADAILTAARESYEVLVPQIPYIGGGDNQLTASLVESVRCLALYHAMKRQGLTPAQTGEVLYKAILASAGKTPSPIPPSQQLTLEQLMERRKLRAERSQQRCYPQDYVYEFVRGDGQEFDYGYDFLECATCKFFHAQGADEFTPFYCYLDFPKSSVFGLGLCRYMTLAQGHQKCDHRFKRGRETPLEWPPTFLKR